MTALLQNSNGISKIIRQFSFDDKNKCIKQIKNANNEAIVDKFELETFFQNHPKKYNYNGLIAKIKELEVSLSKKYSNKVDPVLYFIKLYFKEELPIRDIVLRLNEMGVIIPRSTLNNTFKNVFGWELRDCHDITKVSSRKNKVKPIISSYNPKRTQEITETKKLFISDLLSKKKPFSLDTYILCKNHKERVAYIFSLYSICNTEEESEKYIISLQKGGFSMLTISEIIKRLFNDSIPSNLGISIPKIGSSEINKMYFSKNN